jgi:hypothetical protein
MLADIAGWLLLAYCKQSAHCLTCTTASINTIWPDNAAAVLGVLQEASIAWEKRQQVVRARRQQQKDAAAWANFWADSVGGAAGANMYAQATQASRQAAEAARKASWWSSGDGGSSTNSSRDEGDSTWSDSFDEGDPSASSSWSEAGASVGGKDGQRIAALAAKAARASRAWKSMQELQQQQKGRPLLSAVSVSVDAP